MLMLIFGGLLVAMGGKLWAVKWVIFAGLLITFGGMFCITAYAMLHQSGPRKSKRASPRSAEPVTLAADTTNKLLPVGDNDFLPSVVENTTELLGARVPRKSSDD